MADKRGMPSMLALLGLLAFAGYQNRDKIGDVLKKAAGGDHPGEPPGEDRTGLERLLWDVGDAIGGRGGQGGSLSSGLGDLVDRFRQSGQGEVADSWVQTGPSRGLTPEQVEAAIGAANIAELAKRTGLSHDELLERLATRIPEGVDELTPEGHLPADDDELLHRADMRSPLG